MGLLLIPLLISSMSTFLFDCAVFGPVTSRRFGSSLGVNLLSTTSKVCNFDCIYCECGSSSTRGVGPKFAALNHVVDSLEQTLSGFALQCRSVDYITFAGNGEPTLHPHFEQIVDKVIYLKEKLMPGAKVAVLSNATTLHKSSVVRALQRVDKRVLKLDAGNEDTFQCIDRPLGGTTLSKVCHTLKNVFNGDLSIQSMFLRGTVNGHRIDNTKESEVKAWIDRLIEIGPSEVMLYSLDRDPAMDTLEKVPGEELKAIARQLHHHGLLSTVST